jgi:hypothetical protein
LNVPQRVGVAQGAKFSAPNSQETNAGKAAKVNSGSKVTSQTPRGAVSTQ